MGYVLAPPRWAARSAPIYRRADHFTGLTGIDWHGWDGSIWPLRDGGPDRARRGVVLLSARGLGFGEQDSHESESPALHGAAYQGYRLATREVHLAIEIYSHVSGADMLDLDAAFARSMLPATSDSRRGPGHLVVTGPAGQRRWLELYPAHRGDWTMDHDPFLHGWRTIGQYLRAYRPLWTGDPLDETGTVFTAAPAGGAFLGGGPPGGSGPPFQIGQSSTLAQARASNPGEEPVWLTWDLTGPGESWTIGVDGHETTITTHLGAGETLHIDTDPLARTITTPAGQQVWPQITGDPWAPLPPDPPGTDQGQPITLRVTGGDGTVRLGPIHPLYHRAW